MERNDMEKIYLKYKDTVYRAAFSCCKDCCRAEEVVSDVFYRCFTGKNVPEDEEHLKAWLIRTAINRSKDIFRAFSYKNVVSLDEAQLIYETPEEIGVHQAVMELEPKYRIVIHLYYYEGYTTAEIAGIIRRTNGTVRSRLSRAREMLRKSLGKEFQI